MNKKNESALGLVPLKSPPALSMVSAQTRIDGNHDLTKREVSIIDRLHEQHLVLDADSSKTRFDIQKMGEVKMYAATQFLETAAYLSEIKQEAYGTDYQPEVWEFCDYLRRLSAHHILGAVELSAATMSQVIGESLYPLPEPRRGLIQRLFGG